VNLFYQPLLPHGVHYLDKEESRHSTKVLRLKTGDPIHITDGKGFLYSGRITDAHSEKCSFEVEARTAEKARPRTIHIAIAPTRQPDRLEWFVEKAVEIGVDVVSLLGCDHATRTRFKIDRLQNGECGCRVEQPVHGEFLGDQYLDRRGNPDTWR
jgi:16S rRNA (uracil1498-N3)-methyltransferase